MIRYVTRYNLETRKWEYGYHKGAVFVVVAKYPNMEKRA